MVPKSRFSSESQKRGTICPLQRRAAYPSDSPIGSVPVPGRQIRLVFALFRDVPERQFAGAGQPVPATETLAQDRAASRREGSGGESAAGYGYSTPHKSLLSFSGYDLGWPSAHELTAIQIKTSTTHDHSSAWAKRSCPGARQSFRAYSREVFSRRLCRVLTSAPQGDLGHLCVRTWQGFPGKEKARILLVLQR